MITDSCPPCRRGLIGDRALTATALGMALLALTGCATSSGAASATRSRPPGASSAPARSPTASPSATTLRSIPVAPGAGRLAQTRSMPKAHGPAFHAMVTDLWLAVRKDKPSLARPAFFPLAAYKQVKAIYNAAADWRSRLLLGFSLDVKAAQPLLGRHAGGPGVGRGVVPAGAGPVPPGGRLHKAGDLHAPRP